MLNENNDLLSYFEKEMDTLASKEIKTIEDDIEAIRSSNLQNIENEIKIINESVHIQDLQEIQGEHAIDCSKIREEFNHKLMEKRNELANNVFDKVKSQLNDFIKTKKYDIYLKTKIAKMNDYCENNNYVMYICNTDKAKIKELEALVSKGSSVIIDPHMHLGGCRFECISLGVVSDDSFDTTINEQQKWFYANSKLFVK